MTEDLTLDELLIAHAAAKLPEPVALIVATHLALSPKARARYARYEAIGGVLLDELEPAPLADDAWLRLQARLDEPAEPAHVEPRPAGRCGEPVLPWPLRGYLPDGLDSLRWRSYGTATEAELPVKAPGYRTTLMRIGAGKAVPRHTHEGCELTLVLDGAFHDGFRHYRRGDLAIDDNSVDHQPTADAEQDCLCLAVTDAPLRLTGLFGRFLNPFIRF